MKRIIISGSIIKYPWGGLIQYWLAWLVGLKKLGHDVYYVEDVEWEYACYNVKSRIMTNDPNYDTILLMYRNRLNGKFQMRGMGMERKISYTISS